MASGLAFSFDGYAAEDKNMPETELLPGSGALSTRVKTAAIAVAGFFAFGFAFSTTVGRPESLYVATTTLTAQPTGPAVFLHDDVSELPESIISFMEATPEKGNAHITSTNTEDLGIDCYNDILKDHPVATGEYAYPYNYVAEPYKATTLEATNFREDAWYKWVVDGHVQGYGSKTEVAFTSVGYHDVILTEKIGKTVSVVAIKVMCKYVRREIRSMPNMDREKFFHALAMMSVIPTEVGQRLYGSDYKSKDYFNRVHLYFGGTADCDHWHQGAGFVTSHIAFTLEFEKSTQSIFPDAATPYWDFTMESTFYGANDWRQSKIFSSSWFGDASPENDLHTVTEGRFGWTPAMTHAWNFSAITNSYGVLRAPWNNDPTPFMTRHDHVYGYMNNMKPSGCQEYHTAMKKTTWMSMSKQLNSAAHGHIHETMGGSWNHYFAERNNHNTAPAILTFAHEIQALSKELWRAGFVQCPDTCSMDTPWKECQCLCAADALEGLEPYDVLDQSGVLKSVEFYDHENHLISSWYDENGTLYYTLPDYSEEESKHIYAELLDMLCSPGHIGDMFQATSSNDVMFWVLHGTLDRLWHFKRLGSTENYDETWDPYHTCYGHNPTNFQPFKNLFDQDTETLAISEHERFYTNEELYEYLRPDSLTMPYMYDNFDWPHCELIGYKMTNY